MDNYVKSFALIFLFTVIIISCVEHNIEPRPDLSCNSNNEVSFAQDIHSIIVSNCALTGCHNGDNGESRNWLVTSNFISHASSVKDRITRPATDPGHMPKVGSISDDQIRTIVCWVDQGAKNN